MLGRVSATDYGMVHAEIQRGENDRACAHSERCRLFRKGYRQLLVISHIAATRFHKLLAKHVNNQVMHKYRSFQRKRPVLYLIIKLEQASVSTSISSVQAREKLSIYI